jgi:hypothetical protein
VVIAITALAYTKAQKMRLKNEFVVAARKPDLLLGATIDPPNQKKGNAFLGLTGGLNHSRSVARRVGTAADHRIS